MASVTIRAEIKADIEKVWNTVTSLENYQWRSDIVKIEILEDNRSFIEYTKDGYSTTFEINEIEYQRKYAFKITNENIKGTFVGYFSAVNNKTLIEFTETITTKKILMKMFLKPYLKKQQDNYVKDLKNYLECKGDIN